MKRFLLLCLLLGIVSFGISQNRSLIPKNLRDIEVKRVHTPAISDLSLFENTVNPTVASDQVLAEEVIGTSDYDLQTNASLGNRLYYYPDGTIAAVWTMGFDDPDFADRGTGYNYYNGTAWGAQPTARIETVRTGWPSIAPWGANGEILIAHSGNATSGLVINKRETKGTGAWTATSLFGPEPDWKSLLWPRMVTSGPNHEYIHVVAPTTPTGNGGIAYQGQDPAILYNRSDDGGVTWSPNNVVLEGTGSSYYTGLGADEVSLAEPVGNNIAFIVTDPWHDLFVMKSEDNGDNWEKIMIWEHPYPFFDWNSTITTDTLWAPDGSAAVAIDSQGKVHVVVALSRVAHFEVGTTFSYWPYSDGIAYWNEDRPPFTAPDMHDALNPEILVEDYSLIGWTQDVDGNGVIDILAELMSYRELGISTMPQLTIDDQDHLFLTYAATTEGFDNGTLNFKHIWMRASGDGGNTWSENFYDATSDLIHIFDECIYPVASDNTNGNDVNIYYNTDATPGTALDGDHSYQVNNEYFNMVNKNETWPDVIWVGTGNNKVEELSMGVYPNPCNDLTVVQIKTLQAGDVNVQLTNAMGSIVKTFEFGTKQAGLHNLKLDVRSIEPGIYFCTVNNGGLKGTSKLVIE